MDCESYCHFFFQKGDFDVNLYCAGLQILLNRCTTPGFGKFPCRHVVLTVKLLFFSSNGIRKNLVVACGRRSNPNWAKPVSNESGLKLPKVRSDPETQVGGLRLHFPAFQSALPHVSLSPPVLALLMVTALLRAPHQGEMSESQHSLQVPQDSLIIPFFSYVPTPNTPFCQEKRICHLRPELCACS